MAAFIKHLRKNLDERRADTVGVIAGLIFAIIVLWVVLDGIFWIGFLGLLIAAPLVIWGSRRLPQLAWFWKPDESSEEPAEATSETISADNTDSLPPSERPQPAPIDYFTGVAPPGHCETVRETPQGTMVVSLTSDEAVLKVKSAIRFWCWFLPTTFIVMAVVSVPLGSMVGFMIYAEQRNNFRLDPSEYMFWGALIPAVICLVVAWMTFGSTRPWVRISITPEAIRYGDALYDRQFSNGMRIGYTSDEADLKTSLLAPSFGVQALRLTYGRWGEDLKYMVNKHHASEIVIWMNEIIDSVGSPPPKRYDPYAGQKIELL